jgi:hypothetical protein
LTSILINVSLFHGEAPFVFAAASLQTALKYTTEDIRMALKTGELHFLLEINGPTFTSPWKDFVIAARVIELGRLRELTRKGSLASPTSLTQNGTSYLAFGLVPKITT